LCPTNFSEPSQAALQAAARMAHGENAELLFLFVTASLEAVPGIVSTQEFEDAAREELTEMLCVLIEKCVPSEVRACPLVSIGAVGAEISRTAEREKADANVMATHGRSGWARLAFGSVANEVMHDAPCPVFAVGPECGQRSRRACLDYPFRQVLCPTDWSEPSGAATEEAAAWCRHVYAELLLLHVVAPPHFALSKVEEDALWYERQREAQEKFAALCQSRPATRSARYLLARGDAATEIVRMARGECADLIVMNTHGALGLVAGVKRAFGSVARKVLAQAPCPVLVTHASRAAVAPYNADFFVA